MDEHRTNGDIEETAAASEEPATADVVESLREELGRRTAEAERNWQQFLRAAADLENYRKQALRQRDEAVAVTRRTMLNVVLGVVDTLERALEHGGNAPDGAAAGSNTVGSNAAAIIEGIRLAHRQLLDTLRGMNVRPMESLGRTFDPRTHEAIDAVAADATTPSGTVVAELQRGYTIGDAVLRAARVRVAQ